MEIYRIKNLTFTYPESIHPALDNVNITINKGEWLLICGKSGCGKTTLLKHLVSVMAPQGKLSGDVIYNGKPLNAVDRLTQSLDIGYVMQNPDNQIVSAVVEEDVAFGPENLGVPTEKIWEQVNYALKAVDMTAYRLHSPMKLSGGQKQRVAIAGIIAMEPKCIILDEPTAMLDPIGREEVISTLEELNKAKNITIILITHHMSETIHADKIFVMNK